MVELRSLMRDERILDGQFVEAEFVGELAKLCGVGLEAIDPDESIGVFEVV